MKSRRFLAAIVGLCVLAVVVAIAYQPRPLIVVELGAADSEKFLDNFHAAERGYRWSQDKSALWLSGLGAGNLPWTITLRLSGSRPAGIAPPLVKLSANGRLLDSFAVSADERDYSYTLAPGETGLNGDLLLEIESETFTPPNDPRALGVRVVRVQAAPAAGFALPALKTLALLLAIVAAGWVVAWVIAGPADEQATLGQRVPRELGPTSRGQAERGEHLERFGWLRAIAEAPWRAVVWPTSVAVLGALLIALNRVEGAWWICSAGVAAVGAAALAAATSRILPRAVFTRRQWWLCLSISGLAILVRLLLDTGRGYEGDVALYMAWVWKTVHYGIQSAYLPVTAVPPTDNPPMLIYPLWLMGSLYRQVFSPLLPPPWLNDPPILRFMLRLPALAADLLTAALIARVSAARGARVALAAAALYLFNPALLFDGAYWGQTAALHSFWMLAAAAAAMQPAFALAAVSITLAMLTKPQALAAAPLVAFAAWRAARLTRFATAALITLALVLLPFLLTDSLPSVVQQYAQTAEVHPLVSVNAHNFWWLITRGQGWQPDGTLILGPLSFRSAGILLFALASLLSLGVLWRDRSALYRVAAFQSFAFFMLLTQIHENHLIPMFAPLVVACALERKGWWLFGALALTTLANMALHDPNLVMALGYPADEIYGGPALAWPRWINAAAQTMLFAVFAAQMVGRLRQRHGTTPV